MKTKDRIIQASLEMFNEQGERNVTTNHIAAHLGISPGNLYYHFRNKSDIIFAIFKSYEALVDDYLALPKQHGSDIETLINYLESTVSGLWASRFLHRDLEHLMESDPRLRTDYRQFTLRCLDAVQVITRFMEQSGLYRPLDDARREALALNVWLIVTNWMTYLKTIHRKTEITRRELSHGVYQMLEYLIPYLDQRWEQEARDLQRAYYCPDILRAL
jgi:AcrR family transcriptional regulator